MIVLYQKTKTSFSEISENLVFVFWYSTNICSFVVCLYCFFCIVTGCYRRSIKIIGFPQVFDIMLVGHDRKVKKNKGFLNIQARRDARLTVYICSLKAMPWVTPCGGSQLAAHDPELLYGLCGCTGVLDHGFIIIM